MLGLEVIGQTGERIVLLPFFFILVFIVFWFLVGILLCVWIYGDAKSRGMNGALWLIIILIANIVGFIVYLLVREEKRARVQRPPPISEQIRFCKYCGQEVSADWLHLQILERFAVLEYANVVEGSSILEIGCGPHALATIPLAALVGENGRVVSVDIGRWGNFWKILNQSGLSSRVIPLQEDATKLPFPFSCFDLVACVHSIRSFNSRESIVKTFGEMLRITKERIFIAESSPIAKNDAQEAHLSMYNLRHPNFLASSREYLGDLHYFMPEELRSIIIEAGASKVDLRLVDVDMPHHLAYFPLEEIKKIEDKAIREDLEGKWRHALEMLDKYGEEHPPVIVTTCWK